MRARELVAFLLVLVALVGGSTAAYAGTSKTCAPTGWQADGALTRREGCDMADGNSTRADDDGKGSVQVAVPRELFERSKELSPRLPWCVVGILPSSPDRAFGLGRLEHAQLNGGVIAELAGADLDDSKRLARRDGVLETEGEARQRLASLATEGYAGWLAQASFEQLRLVRDAIESLADVVRRGDVRTLKRAIKVLRDEDSIEGQRRRMAGWLEATFWETFRSSRGKPTLKLYSGTTRGADPEEEHAARCRHLRLAFVRDDEAWANLSDVDVREALDARKNVGVLYVLARLAVVAGVEKGPASESRFQSLARTYANAKKSGRQTKRGQEMTRVIK